jgi:hypothetical protein
MRVLQPIDTPQALIFIPRFDTDTVSIILTHEVKQLDYNYELATTYTNGLMQVEITHDFKEGESYSFQVEDLSNELMYRGKIFITAQTDLQDYRTNPDFLYA